MDIIKETAVFVSAPGCVTLVVADPYVVSIMVRCGQDIVTFQDVQKSPPLANSGEINAFLEGAEHMARELGYEVVVIR